MSLEFRHFSRNFNELMRDGTTRFLRLSAQFYSYLRRLHCTLSAHENGLVTKLAPGSWRAQVRHKGRYVSESFQRREDARRWATEMEGRIDRGELATSARARGIATFGQLIDLHVADMKDVGKAPGGRRMRGEIR